jgi:hypothetical protein
MMTEVTNAESCRRKQSLPKRIIVILLDKCKAIPLQAWTGPEGFRRLRLPDFKTIGT